MAEIDQMDRSVAFYRDVLGMTVTYESPHWTALDLGGASIGLHPRFSAPDGPRGGGWILGYAVSDLKALHDKLVAAGAKIVNAFHDVPGGVLIQFEDPDGNALQAIQRGTSRAELVG